MVHGNDKSLRRKRFERVAARRVQMVLHNLGLLGNCANRNNYEYSEVDCRKMFAAIREKVKEAETLFDKELTRSSKGTFKF